MVQDPRQAGAPEGGETIGSWRVTYAPGDWVVLAGPDALVVMPPAPARVTEFVTAVWESIVPAVSIDDLVAELGRAGVTEMPDMAALFWDAGSMHSLVRGRLRVVDTASGEVIATGEGVRTWSESGLGDVRSVRVEAVDGGVPPDDVLYLPLVVGAVRAHSLLVETSPERLVAAPVPPPRAAVGQPSAGRPAVGGEPVHGQVYDPMHPENDEPAHHTAGLPAVALGGAAAGAGAAAAAAGTAGTAVPAPAPAPAPTTAPAPVPVPAPITAGQGAVGPDAATQLIGGVPSEEVTQLLGQGGPAGRPSAGAEPTGQGTSVEPMPVMALLRPITGAPVAVDRMVLIGRAPSPDRAGPGVVARLMTVPSPSHDISRTHVKVEPVGRTVQVTDLHSTNGTVLITGPIGGDPSLAGQRHQLVPGEPVAVQPGWILDLGDGVTILIDRA
ncbi:FHA domain-containing protein [Raineyella sp. W15-4]|uniref:FHA domain-containing protein n=1 Tax=Raineyella sp. W15-4 TaxID=3081651 RepID=UPI002955BA10|nr:FHA domain-containing protein [Raineyella sp. W15-4]WOQ16647.1 FHA domain-containing protein [Raineyella sp. W15-4]